MAQKEEELKLEEQENPTTVEEQTTPVTTGVETSSTSQEESTTQTRTPITAQHVEAPKINRGYLDYWEKNKSVDSELAANRMFWEAVGKGLTSLAEYHKAKKGSTVAPMYKGLKTEPIYNAAVKERQTNSANLRKSQETLAKLGAKYDKDNADLWYKAEKDNADRDLKAKTAEAAQQNKDAESGAKVKKTEGETENAAKVAESVVNKNNAAAEKAKADAESNRIKANKSGSSSGSGSGSKGKTYTLKFDKEYTTDSKEEYEKRVHKAAKKLGVSTEYWKTYKDEEGNAKEQLVKKPISQLAAEAENAYRKKHPQGSGSSGSKGSGYDGGNKSKSKTSEKGQGY